MSNVNGRLAVARVQVSTAFCPVPVHTKPIPDSATSPNRRRGSQHCHFMRSGPLISTNASQLGRLSPKPMDGTEDTTLAHRSGAPKMGSALRPD